jgi:cobalt-zinc-cadmium efflux system membrane fusion protein
MKFLKSINIIIVLFSISISSLFCGRSEVRTEKAPEEQNQTHIEEENNEVTLTDAQFNTAAITFGTIEMKQISGTFKANGVLDVPPQQKVSISVPMGGFLKSTDLLQGKRVKKGELIAVIENPEYVQMQQEYLEAKSQWEYAQADYERQQKLSQEYINSQKTLQQSKATFQSLKAKVNGLKERIKVSGISLARVERGDIQSAINIYSPISGFVTEVNVNIGKFVNPADILFEIVDTEHLHVELTVFEKDVPKLEIGQRVRFTLANETTERTAKVYLIGREINDDRTVRVHCHIDKEDIHLLAGMYLKAVIETGKDQVPALPEEAIVDHEGEKFIFVPSEDEQTDSTKIESKEHTNESHHFKMVSVQTGNSDMGYVEVKMPEGIDVSKIVTKGSYALLSKMKNSEEEGHGH